MNRTPLLSVACSSKQRPPRTSTSRRRDAGQPWQLFWRKSALFSGQRRHQITTVCRRKRLERDGEDLKKTAEANECPHPAIQPRERPSFCSGLPWVSLQGPGTKTLMVFAHLLEVLPSARAGSGEVGRKCCIFSTLMCGFLTKAHCSNLSMFISKVCFLK